MANPSTNSIIPELPDGQSTCQRCDGRGRIEPGWPVGPSGNFLADYPCSTCDGTVIVTISRPVMNPPADEAEAGNRANAAPQQPDPDGLRRGETGASAGSEARPVIATEQHNARLPESLAPRAATAVGAESTAAGAIPMLLWCPNCGSRHIDAGEFATRVHHTHACQSCGMVWRPAVVPTVGVLFLPGFKNE